jgi:cytochrome c oxidase assembly protein subunit 15
MVTIIKSKPKLYWLLVNAIMIILMVSIGGITRLTDSGLSMTEWSLIGGILPPTNYESWLLLFEKYKLSPEFQINNYDMTLSEFKNIFFWEYFHRIWGRLIGVVFFVPFILFWIFKRFSFFEKFFFAFLLFLGSFQAFMGWFMVKSGLIDKPDVSHFRLSAHLSIAFIIYSFILYFGWTKFRLFSGEGFLKNYDFYKSKYNLILLSSIVLTILTIISGAFVAGTKAGLAYNNFPLMGDNLLPPILIDRDYSNFIDLFYDLGSIQFFHRTLATTTLLILLSGSFYIKRSIFLIGFLAKVLIVILSLQYLLGILILKLYVPIPLGIMHQIGSLIVLSILITMLAENNMKGTRFSCSLVKND